MSHLYDERVDSGETGGRRIRLTGDRFKGGRLPIDSLIELERYQDAVRLLSENEWRRDHPGEALPESFNASVSLAIEKIENGSADVFLAFEQQVAYAQYQAEARDAVEATIEAAYTDRDLPDLPASVRQQVRETVAMIGSTLRGDQTFELYNHGAGEKPVQITVTNRVAAVERLVLPGFLLIETSSSTNQLRRLPTSLIGRVTALDADSTRYEMDLPGLGRVHGWYRDRGDLLDDFRAVLHPASEGPLTRVFGDLQYRGGAPWRFMTTDRVELIEFDDTPWGRALTDFATLSAGWADGNGVEVSSVALDAAQTLLRRVSGMVAAPALGPTEDGGVLLEWISSTGIRSVEILPEGEFELFVMGSDENEGTQTETRDVSVAATFAVGGVK